MGCNASSSSDDKDFPSTYELKLVLETWRYLYSHKKHTGIILIQRLICSDDAIRMLFEGFLQTGGANSPVWNVQDVQKHGLAVMDTIDVALNGIDDLENLSIILCDLGERHATYGVQEKMFVKLWEAMESTFKTLLRDAFTKDVRNAWYKVFKFMITGIVKGLNKTGAGE